MDDKLKDALDAMETLVTSDGWQQLRAFVQTEWGNDGFAQKVESLHGDAVMVQVALAELMAARLAVRTLMAWPHERINQLRSQQEGAPAVRGAGRF